MRSAADTALAGSPVTPGLHVDLTPATVVAIVVLVVLLTLWRLARSESAMMKQAAVYVGALCCFSVAGVALWFGRATFAGSFPLMIFVAFFMLMGLFLALRAQARTAVKDIRQLRVVDVFRVRKDDLHLDERAGPDPHRLIDPPIDPPLS